MDTGLILLKGRSAGNLEKKVEVKNMWFWKIHSVTSSRVSETTLSMLGWSLKRAYFWWLLAGLNWFQRIAVGQPRAEKHGIFSFATLTLSFKTMSDPLVMEIMLCHGPLAVEVQRFLWSRRVKGMTCQGFFKSWLEGKIQNIVKCGK